MYVREQNYCLNWVQLYWSKSTQPTKRWHTFFRSIIKNIASVLSRDSLQFSKLLKIHLNLFEISNRVLKFETLILIWKSFISSENLFQTWTLRNSAMYMYSSLSRDKLEYMHIATLLGVHVWNNFETRFEISNKYKPHFKT